MTIGDALVAAVQTSRPDRVAGSLLLYSFVLGSSNMKRKTFLMSIVTAPFAASCKRQPSPSTTTPSPSKAEQFAARIVDDTNTAYFVAAAYIGDRLGLFKTMAGAGPMTAKQLAEKTGFNERYLLEWLRTMAAVQYVDYQRETTTFELPGEHVAVLVDEDSPIFSSGLIEGTIPDIFMVPRVLAAFKSGKGISYGEYPPETFDAIERITKPDYRHSIAQRWIPAISGMVDRLRSGGSAADLGSGAGLASISIAKAFPQARAVGFEPYPPSVARARQNAQAAGVADRVKFETFDGVHVPGGPYDLITINYSLLSVVPVMFLKLQHRTLVNRMEPTTFQLGAGTANTLTVPTVVRQYINEQAENCFQR
jgi:hypothetical protein